jgi:hypothetical protein
MGLEGDLPQSRAERSRGLNGNNVMLSAVDGSRSDASTQSKHPYEREKGGVRAVGSDASTSR